MWQKVGKAFAIILIIASLPVISYVALGSIDLSGDGLSVREEIQYGTNPLVSDTSGDGLTDYEEIRVYGTNPLVQDTNGNGYTDYQEVQFGAEPTVLNTNGVGLTDAENFKYGTDPQKEDTSGDGLTDYEEVYVYGTDPLVQDTNGNGYTDYQEVQFGADPLLLDTNQDGLSDAENFEYGADPTATDTNGDGISDFDAVRVYGIDPVALDTARNGLSDAKEIEIGTDPTRFDSSGDGLPDGFTYYDGGLEVDRFNFIVEIAVSEGASIPPEIFEIIDYLDTIPIESDMGKQGVNLVFIEVSDDSNIPESRYTENSFREYIRTVDTQFSGYGAHQLALVEEFDDENILGAAYTNTDVMIVQDVGSTRLNGDLQTTKTILHEIGHQMGLHKHSHPGIDSFEYTWDEYPSVMNYNNPIDPFRCGIPCIKLQFAPVDYDILQENFDKNQASIERLEEQYRRSNSSPDFALDLEFLESNILLQPPAE